MAPQQNTGGGAEADLPEYAGQYRLESCLGSGGMGVVHLARSASGLKLAVKVVHAEFAKDPEFRGRFRQEVAAARRVSGAFTAPVVDADPEAERPWMATLFIPGPTLSDQVKQNGPMTPSQLRRMMAGLAEALRDIHRVGVVHRDLKPSNVLLAEDGPKVIDFGISRPKDSELRTETGKLIGTPPFMAPEQFRRPREVGPAADIFALGSVMVHAATGRGPFDSDSPYVVAYQVVHDEPDLAGVPEDLVPLVLRCLAKEPDDRPTPDELMRELRSVAASHDTQAFIPGQRTVDAPALQPGVEKLEARPGKRPRRNVVFAGAALVLAVGGVLLSVLSQGGPATTPTGDTPWTTGDAFRAWETTPVSEDGNAAQCSHSAGKLFCGQPGLIFALDPSDGTQLWRHAVARTIRSGPPLMSGGLVQPLTGRRGALEALDPASGRTRWQRASSAYDALRQAGDMLLLTGADGTVTGVNSATGKTEWSHAIPGQGMPYFTSFAGNPLAYATSASDDGSSTYVTAVDPHTGDVRWAARLKGVLKPFGTAGGSVFFLSVDQVYERTTAVVRYTPGSASTRRVALPVPLERAHATVHGHVVYLLAAGGSLEAVDMVTGKRLWHVETSVTRGSAPVEDGGHVYFTAADGRLLAFDADKGGLIGQTRPRLGTSAEHVAAALPEPLLLNSHVYASAPDGTVFAVDGRHPSSW
jgi:outer membrane protein assembly factor BamB